MILVVGLGNPGSQYAKTRHNVGFMVIDELAKDNFDIINSTKFKGELFKKGSLLLLKPQTFMNSSGISVKAVKDFYKPERIIVIHDDIDLNFGTMKFKTGGSSGGHNGIKSIDSLIGNDYERVRIGVGRDNKNVINFVLSNFSEDEDEKLKKILAYAKNATLELVNSNISEISQKWTIKKAKT